MIEKPGLQLELELWHKGYELIGGVDEVGRGAWAGPIMAGAVVLPQKDDLQHSPAGVRDSKKMSATQRDYWTNEIKSVALAWSIGSVSNLEIDRIGILPANRLAMQRAIEGLVISPQYFLLDFIHWKDCPYPCQKLVKGESQSLSIAAASVLAKTTRDACMRELDEQFPGYKFSRHKGYGTAIHRAAIQDLGLAEIHRKSFKILK